MNPNDVLRLEHGPQGRRKACIHRLVLLEEARIELCEIEAVWKTGDTWRWRSPGRTAHARWATAAPSRSARCERPTVRPPRPPRSIRTTATAASERGTPARRRPLPPARPCAAPRPDWTRARHGSCFCVLRLSGQGFDEFQSGNARVGEKVPQRRAFARCGNGTPIRPSGHARNCADQFGRAVKALLSQRWLGRAGAGAGFMPRSGSEVTRRGPARFP